MKTVAFLGEISHPHPGRVGFRRWRRRQGQKHRVSVIAPRHRPAPPEPIRARPLPSRKVSGPRGPGSAEQPNEGFLRPLWRCLGCSRSRAELPLAAALAAAFERRGTPLPVRRPVGSSAAFGADPAKSGQWNAFRRREHLLLEVPDLAPVTDEIAAFVMPPARGCPCRRAL